MTAERRLVIVGGGIAGLAAAWEASHRSVEVEVLDAGAVPGGKLRTSPLAGTPTDEAADMFLARVPDGRALAEEIGLGDRLIQPSAGGAAVWADGAAHPLPGGLVLGVPTDADLLEGSALVGPHDVAATRAELARSGPPLTADCSIGALIRDRLGDRIADRLVAPILGGINAGVIDRLSLAAVAPQLDAAARSGPSLTAALAAGRSDTTFSGVAGPPPAPVFHGLPGGMAQLVDALRSALAQRGVRLSGGVSATSVRRRGGRLEVTTAAGSDPATGAGPAERIISADAVIVATPAAAAAALLEAAAPRTSARLGRLRTSSVAMVRLALRPQQVLAPPGRAGLLVPHHSGLITAAISYASTKWEHLGGDGLVRLRISVGHDGDHDSPRLPEAELVTRVLGEAAMLTGLDGPPVDVSVLRWPEAFPQYDVGHLDACAAMDATLAEELPGVRLTGASYRGLGIPACVREGRAAAASAVEG
ncbi:MAG: protoporphyrinogen oxidase [Microthrixaceae bacterium]